MEKTKEISVFIDESGSFDREDIASRYYLVCLVFHDQAVDLTEHFAKFDEELRNLGLGESHCIHAGPLIRREQDYRNMNREERRFIFSKMLAFARKAELRTGTSHNDSQGGVCAICVQDGIRAAGVAIALPPLSAGRHPLYA